MAKYKIQQDV